MENLLDVMEPTVVAIGEKKVPLFFSLRAAARMEQRLEASYTDIVNEMFQIPDADGVTRPPMSWDRQAALVACLIQEGGVDLSAEDIMNLHVSQFNALCEGAVTELLRKMPKAKAGKK